MFKRIKQVLYIVSIVEITCIAPVFCAKNGNVAYETFLFEIETCVS